MTEDQARAICTELGATLSIKRRRGIPYVYVARWLPRDVVEAAGWKATKSNGQQIDRYIAPLAKLGEVEEATFRAKIAELPQNPNKLPRVGAQLALWPQATTRQKRKKPSGSDTGDDV